MITKICTKCKKPKPSTIEFFSPLKKGKYGLHSWCRECLCKHIREYQYEKYTNDHEYCKRKKKYSREKQREYMHEHRKDPEFREKEKKRQRKYYQNNPEYRKKRREYHRQWYKDNPNKAILAQIKARSQKIKLDYDLTEEWIQERLDKGICEATGLRFIQNKNSNKREPLQPSIDRIDPDKGYTKDNCQMVIWMYNRAKDNHKLELFYKMCKAFVEKYDKKMTKNKNNT